MSDAFDDVLSANAEYARRFALGGLVPKAGKGLAVVTCMDSRIELIASSAGIDTRSLEFRTTPDQIASLTEDLTRIKAHPMLPGDLAVAGAMYDVETGVLTRVA